MFQEQHKQTRLKQNRSLKGELEITIRKNILSFQLQRKTINFEYTTNCVKYLKFSELSTYILVPYKSIAFNNPFV